MNKNAVFLVLIREAVCGSYQFKCLFIFPPEKRVPNISVRMYRIRRLFSLIILNLDWHESSFYIAHLIETINIAIVSRSSRSIDGRERRMTDVHFVLNEFVLFCHVTQFILCTMYIFTTATDFEWFYFNTKNQGKYFCLHIF